MQPVIIFGAKGLGKVALETFQENELIVYGFLEDDERLHGTTINEIPVLGGTEEEKYLELIGPKCEAFIAIENEQAHEALVKRLQEKYKRNPINAIHHTAHISSTASLLHGNLISGGVQIGPETKIGSHNRLLWNATISHEVTLGDFIHIGEGSTIGAGATIENNVFIGAGATIVGGATIEEGARIGIGSVVLTNVKANETVLGNPAKPLKS